MLRAKEAVYGYACSMAAVDEAWKVRPESVEAGLTPTLTWSAPALGHADMYYVWVWKLDATAPPSNKILVALVATTKTSLALPAGILATGGQYVLSFDAYAVKPMAAQPTTVPFLTLPPAGAVVISSVMQP